MKKITLRKTWCLKNLWDRENLYFLIQTKINKQSVTFKKISLEIEHLFKETQNQYF